MNDPCGAVSPGTPIVFHDFPIAVAGEDKVLGCQPNTVSLSANGSATGSNIEYEWRPEDGGIIQGANDLLNINVAAGGTYILVVEDIVSGCVSYDTATVTKSELAIDALQVEVTSPLCVGDCNGTIQLSNADATWLFDFGDGQFTSNDLAENMCAGPATITVMDTFGCVKEAVAQIDAPDSVLVDLGPDQSILLGESVTLNATSLSNLVSFNWFNADPCTTCPAITVSPTETTTYEVEVLDENDCIASDAVTITIEFSKNIYIPRVFSPNGDQVNDIFFIQGSPDLLNISAFEIYDRWGELVFEKHDFAPNDPSQGWDGKQDGSTVNPGVFVYKVEAEFSQGKPVTFVGDITIIR